MAQKADNQLGGSHHFLHRPDVLDAFLRTVFFSPREDIRRNSEEELLELDQRTPRLMSAPPRPFESLMERIVPRKRNLSKPRIAPNSLLWYIFSNEMAICFCFGLQKYIAISFFFLITDASHGARGIWLRATASLGILWFL